MSKILTGSRAKVYISGADGTSSLVAVFDSANVSSGLSADPQMILGRYSPAEITPTAHQSVNVACSGFRIVGQGKRMLPKVPKLQDILNLEGLTLDIVDRKTGETISNVTGCVPVSWSESVQAGQTSKFQVSYMGLAESDEAGDSAEGDAVTLP